MVNGVIKDEDRNNIRKHTHTETHTTPPTKQWEKLVNNSTFT